MTGYVYAAPAGGGLPPRGRWIAAGETDEGPSPAWRGWTGHRPGRVWRGPLKTKDGVRVCSPRRRRPSPAGKVDRAQPGPDEGKVRERSGRLIPTCPVRQVPGRCGHRPLREGRDFSLNWARRMFQRSAPHPSGPLALPPSPEGKAAYRRGTLYFSPPWTCRGPLHTRRKRGHPRKAQRAGIRLEKGQIPGPTPCRPTPVRAFGPDTHSQERVREGEGSEAS